MNEHAHTVLLLGPGTERLADNLAGSRVVRSDEPIALEFIHDVAPDVLVSYGYRHMLPAPVFSAARIAAVNLHISLLPWNRGADPNLWSFLEDTPKGVTIHDIDEGLDTGDIIAQREVTYTQEVTLAATYARLDEEIRDLFAQVWPRILDGSAPRSPQPPGGSFHRAADRAAVEHLLRLGWQTPVAELSRALRQPDE